MNEGYCLRCRKRVSITNSVQTGNKIRGRCEHCKTVVCTFVKKTSSKKCSCKK